MSGSILLLEKDDHTCAIRCHVSIKTENGGIEYDGIFQSTGAAMEDAFSGSMVEEAFKRLGGQPFSISVRAI